MPISSVGHHRRDTLLARNLGLFGSAKYPWIVCSKWMDALSRSKSLSLEATLGQTAFRQILILGVSPQVNLFTKVNAILVVYASPIKDFQAHNTDWCQWNNLFLFPPANFCSQVLKKPDPFQSSVTLTAPFWMAQPWYPHLAIARIQSLFHSTYSYAFWPWLI